MATYQFINPTDQPLGNFRLLDWLENNFRSGDYQRFCCLVAFAKVKPFYKLHDSIQQWNGRRKTSEAVIGIDHRGTSLQALQYALSNFDRVRILHVDYSTFHPKLYIFSGPEKASAYYGSSNFTVGGLETNFEGGVLAEFLLPADQQAFDQVMQCYSSLTSLPAPFLEELTVTGLAGLHAKGLLLDETQARRSAPSSGAASALPNGNPSAPVSSGGFSVKPARPIPKSVLASAASSAGIVLSPVKTPGKKSVISSAHAARASEKVIVPVMTESLVIRVIPHRNGEIHLSKIALDQNPGFFGFPFTGTTVPKKAGNPAYPQRDPDPIVNIRVFDSTGALAGTENRYPLNTIYYETNDEIRITITPAILSALNIPALTTNYPILVMRTSSTAGCDYDCDFYASGSTSYNDYLAVCNQTLPSGGKPVARKMGWL